MKADPRAVSNVILFPRATRPPRCALAAALADITAAFDRPPAPRAQEIDPLARAVVEGRTTLAAVFDGMDALGRKD